MKENSNRKIATGGICCVALGLLLVVAFFKWLGFTVDWESLMVIVGVLWVAEFGVICASDKVCDTIVSSGKQFWEWLKKEFNDLEKGTVVNPPVHPPFNEELTRCCLVKALCQLSNTGIGIKPIILDTEIRWEWILKNGFQFLRFRVKRNGLEPLLEDELAYLSKTIQDRVYELLDSEAYGLPFLLYNGNQWCIITVDDVKQEGIYLLIDVIWVQDQRVADYLYQKHFGMQNSNKSGASPVDEDFRND